MIVLDSVYHICMLLSSFFRLFTFFQQYSNVLKIVSCVWFLLYYDLFRCLLLIFMCLKCIVSYIIHLVMYRRIGYMSYPILVSCSCSCFIASHQVNTIFRVYSIIVSLSILFYYWVLLNLPHNSSCRFQG